MFDSESGTKIDSKQRSNHIEIQAHTYTSVTTVIVICQTDRNAKMEEMKLFDEGTYIWMEKEHKYRLKRDIHIDGKGIN